MSTPYASEAYLHQILSKALSAQAGDVHLTAGKPPGARVRGDVVYFRADKLRPEDTEAIARLVLGPQVQLAELTERVTTYAAGALGRFRVVAYRQRGALALTLRRIPAEVPSLAELGLPASLGVLVEEARGLVVVAGCARQGKSSTLAAMVGHLSARHAWHLVTIEDPIELVHEDGRASVSQRQVGTDTASFAEGLRAALLADADAVMLSAIDGPMTLDAALAVVEAGGLVLAPLSARSVAHALDGLFAVARAPVVGLPRALDLARVIEGVHAIVAQRLVPTPEKGLLAEVEVCVLTPAMREALLRDGNARALAPPAREASPRDQA